MVHEMMAMNSDGNAHGVMIGKVGVAGGRVGRFRHRRRDRRHGIAVLGRGECAGAAFGHGGSIDALDDGMKACVHGFLCLHRSGISVIVRQCIGLRSLGLRGVVVDARWIGATVDVIAIIFRRTTQRRICHSRLRFGGGCPLVISRGAVVDGARIEGAEPGRCPGDGRGAALGRDPGGDAAAVGECVLHRLGDLRLLLLGLRLRPGLTQRLAGDGEDAVLAQPRPQQIGGPDLIAVAPDSGGEIDVEPGHGRFDFGPGFGFERQLTLQRARDAGREQDLLVPFGKRPQFGEGLGIGQAGPVELLCGPVDLEVLLADIDVAESIVVDPHGRTVRGLGCPDVERVVMVAAGEHVPGELEQQQIEGRLEVAGELALDDGRADGPQVVGEADTDARFLARLGFRIAGRSEGSHECGRIDAGDGVLLVTGIVVSGRVRFACFARGHVLGPDQALDQFEFAVVADGGDAPGDGDILAPVDRAGLDRGLDLVEPLFVGIGFFDQLFGPAVVVHVGEFVVAGPEAFDLGLLPVRRLGRLRTHPPEGGGGAPVHVEPRFGPFPARLQFPRHRLEAVHGELVQQIGIVEPDPPLVLFGEQIAVDPATRRLVSLDADETGDGGCSGYPVLGQQALDLPGAWPVALLADRLPDRALARLIRGDGEGHQRFQIDLARPVGLEQHRCGVAEPQAFLHGALRDPEARRDGARRAARIGQAAERLDLIGRVHGGADTVLGQRNFFGRHDASDHAAGHGVVLLQRAFGGQRLHRGQPPPAGDHSVAPGTIRAGSHGTGNQVLEQPVGGDRGLEFGEGRSIGRRLAHIVGREFELGQRDVADLAFGVVHIGLRDCVNAEPGGDTLFGIRPRPPSAQALALAGVTEPDGAGTAGPCKDS